MIEEGKRVRYTALAQHVIAVAIEGYADDWTAYIDAVPGYSHEREWRRVLDNGDKLPKHVAMVIFPDFKDLTWRS